MSNAIEHLLGAFRRLPDAEKQEFLARLEADRWYRTMVRHLQQDWDDPRDDAYNNL